VAVIARALIEEQVAKEAELRATELEDSAGNAERELEAAVPSLSPVPAETVVNTDSRQMGQHHRTLTKFGHQHVKGIEEQNAKAECAKQKLSRRTTVTKGKGKKMLK
jgi:hypothetical protein